MILKKIRLNEAASQSFVQPLSQVVASLDQSAKDVLIRGLRAQDPDDVWKHPEEYFVRGAALPWTEAYESSGVNAKSVVKLFILCDLVGTSITEEQANDFGNELVHIISEMGFREYENPFLIYLKLVKGKIELKRADVILINNLWANDVINGYDISGKGEDRGNHLVFNPHAFTQKHPRESDRWGMFQAWRILSRRKVNLDAIEEGFAGVRVAPTNYATIKSIVGGNVSARDAIMLKDPKNKLGELNSYYWVYRAAELGLGSTPKSTKAIEREASNIKSGIVK